MENSKEYISRKFQMRRMGVQKIKEREVKNKNWKGLIYDIINKR